MGSPSFEAGKQSGKTEADMAMERANNARQMVLNRDPILDQLQTAQAQLLALSASYAAALPASVADRADLHQQIDALRASLAAVELTPGPAGKDGRDGAAGTPADMSRVAALEAALAAQPKVSRGWATNAGTITGAGGTRDITVTLTPPMPDTIYVATASMTAASTLLGNMNLTGIIAQTTTSVTVRITNAGLGLIAVGAITVMVVGVK